jgi:peptidyl-prolyl cis-trans isomerase C
MISIITRTHLRNLVLLSCSILLINIACKKEAVSPTENSSPSKQVDKKIPTRKDNSLAVEVNGVKITQNEVDAQINGRLESIKGKLSKDQVEKFRLDMRNKFIENFITRTLLSQEADKQNIIASDNETKLEIDKIEKRLPQGMTLETRLKQSGMNMEKLREDITYSLRVNKLFESQIKTDYKPSDEEIKKYYTSNKKQFGTPETVHARHILIKLDDKDDEKTKGEKKAKIEVLRKQLLEGSDFGKLAKEHSTCPSGKKGGDLGTFPRGRMVNPFEEAAFSQKVNEIGPVFQTKFGYHIIQVLEHNKAIEKTLDEVKDKIKQTLKNRKRQENVKSYIAKLREKAKIVFGTTE